MSFLSQQEHVSDGTLQTVPFSIAFLNVANLHFYIGSDEVTTTIPVAGVLVQQVTAYQVTLTAPVPVGVVFSVRRVTPRTSVPHIFNNGAALFNAANTDENNTYALFIVQEVYEQSGLGPFPGITAIDGTELLYVTVGGVRKQLTLATLLDQAPDVVLDTFKAALANQTDPLKGPGMLGYSDLEYSSGTLGRRIRHLSAAAYVTPFDFMSPAEVSDVVKGTMLLDHQPAIQAAINSISKTSFVVGIDDIETMRVYGGGVVDLSGYKWRIDSPITLGAYVHLIGNGGWNALINYVTDTKRTTVIHANFTNKNQWVIDTANFEVATGNRLPYRGALSGNQVFYTWTDTHGVAVEGITIKGNAAYGGIRMAGSATCSIKNCEVVGVGIPYSVSGSWGVKLDQLHGLGTIYGLSLYQTNGVELSSIYLGHSSTGPTLTTDTRPTYVDVGDMGTGVFFPADWSLQTCGMYAAYCLNINVSGNLITEWMGIGQYLSHVSGFTTQIYGESCGVSNLAAVASAGTLMGSFINNTVAAAKLVHFGFANDVFLAGNIGNDVYVGHARNTVTSAACSGSFSGLPAKWSDGVTYVDLPALYVAPTGAVSALGRYSDAPTTLDEALRRVEGSTQREWTIYVNRGETHVLSSSPNWESKNVRIIASGSGAAPVINVSAGVGISVSGNSKISLRGLSISMPSTAASGAATGLFRADWNAANLEFEAYDCTINQGNGHSLFSVSNFSSALNLNSLFSATTITAAIAAPVLKVTSPGAAVTVNIATGCTVDAGIKAIGTNGFQGTVINSNF